MIWEYVIGKIMIYYTHGNGAPKVCHNMFDLCSPIQLQIVDILYKKYISMKFHEMNPTIVKNQQKCIYGVRSRRKGAKSMYPNYNDLCHQSCRFWSPMS